MPDFGIRDIGDCIGNDYISTETMKHNSIADVRCKQVNSPHYFFQKSFSTTFNQLRPRLAPSYTNAKNVAVLDPELLIVAIMHVSHTDDINSQAVATDERTCFTLSFAPLCSPDYEASFRIGSY
jgi:hypothetical protein